MKINVVLIAVLLIWLMSIIMGGAKGFLKSSLSLIALVLSGVLVMAFNPFVTGFLREHTGLDEWVEGKVYVMIAEQLEEGVGQTVSEVQQEALSTAQQSMLIERLPMPEKLRNSLEENNNPAIYMQLGVEKFTDYIGSFVSNICLNIIGYVVTFLIVFLALHFLMGILNIIDMLPIIHGLNHFAGALLGVIKGFLLIEILFLLLIPFSGTSFGQTVLMQVESNGFLNFLYQKNILIQILTGIAVKI